MNSETIALKKEITIDSNNVKVEINNVLKGMYIAALDVPWTNTKFMFEGFVLESDAEMAELRRHCQWVVVNKNLSTPGVFKSGNVVPLVRPVLPEVRQDRIVSVIAPSANKPTNPSNYSNTFIEGHEKKVAQPVKLTIVRNDPVKPPEIKEEKNLIKDLISSILIFFQNITSPVKIKENYDPNKISAKNIEASTKESIDRIDKASQIRVQFLEEGDDGLISNQIVNYTVSTSVKEETKVAVKLQDSLFDAVASSLTSDFSDSSLGENLNITREAISEVVDSVTRNPDAMQLVSKIKRMDEFSYQHAIDVSLLMVAFGRELCLPKEDLVEIGLGGLLHDVGEIKPPEDATTGIKIKNITKFKLYKEHINEGMEIARKHSYSPIVRQIIENHHEHFDGTGYPRGLTKGQIGMYGNMAAIVDSYVSLTTGRCCDSPVTPNKAMEIIYKQKGKMFNPIMIDQFIQVIGLYPVGTMVKLSTGDFGFVIKQNRQHRLTPVVMVVMSKNGVKLTRPVHVDLHEAKESGEDIAIAAELPADSFGLKVEEYLK